MKKNKKQTELRLVCENLTNTVHDPFTLIVVLEKSMNTIHESFTPVVREKLANTVHETCG